MDRASTREEPATAEENNKSIGEFLMRQGPTGRVSPISQLLPVLSDRHKHVNACLIAKNNGKDIIARQGNMQYWCHSNKLVMHSSAQRSESTARRNDVTHPYPRERERERNDGLHRRAEQQQPTCDCRS